MFDLHLHSYYSADAQDSPETMLRAASRAGVQLLSITDHNCVDHIEPALKAASQTSLRLVPGLELTCSALHFDLEEVHILAHFPTFNSRPWTKPALTRLLEEIAELQFQNLSQLLRGLGISIERLQLARKDLLETGGLADSTPLALHLFKRCSPSLQPLPWVDMKIRRDAVITNLREKHSWHPFPSFIRVLRVLQAVGAVATLAHPARYKLLPEAWFSLIEEMKAEGLDGLEALYLPHFSYRDSLISIANTYGYSITSGSDSHCVDNLTVPAYGEFIDQVTALSKLIALGRYHR